MNTDKELAQRISKSKLMEELAGFGQWKMTRYSYDKLIKSGRLEKPLRDGKGREYHIWAHIIRYRQRLLNPPEIKRVDKRDPVWLRHLQQR